MSGIVGIQVNKEVPIVLQIEDGAVGQYPQAVIRDDEGNLLATLDLVHADNGVYAPASPYLMPNKNYIRVTYVVYTDSGHTVESSLYTRDLDTFVQIYLNDYKADVSGLALANEYDATLSGIQSEVAGLNGEPMRGTDGAYTGTPPTVGEIDVQLTSSHGDGSWLSGTTISGEYDDRLEAIQLDLDTPDQYKANLTNVEAYMLRALGLMQENQYLDQTVYTDYQGTKLLTSGRIRTYSNAGSVGTSNDVIATYQITATWNNNEMTSYKVVKI